MSFARGFQTGWSAVGEAMEDRRKRELREGLKRAGALEPTQQTMADPEMVRNLEAAGINPQTGQPYYTVRDGYVQPNFAVETTAAMPAGPDQIQTGMGVDQIPVVQPGTRGVESRLAPAEAVRIPETTQYQLGGLTRATPFTQPEIQRARTEEMARVYEQQGMPAEAMQMRGLAQQQELTGLQLTQARRQEDYNNALQKINKQKFEKPEDRTAAILAATEAFDPATALKLQNDYTQAELNDITLKAKKFEQNYAESRAKGVDAVLKWYDSVNDGFTLRREGKQIIQTDTAGNQRVFAQGTDDQIMMRMDAIAKPGGFLELAKNLADIRKADAQAEQAKEMAAYLRRDRPQAGKTTPTLTDAEKIAYTEAVKLIGALGPSATTQEIAKIYKSVGLDPARFNVSGMPNWGTTEPGGLAPSPAGLTRTIPAPNVTRGPTSNVFSSIFGTKPPPSNINNLVRERQSNGAYAYRDLSTNELYSIDEYNKLLGVQ